MLLSVVLVVPLTLANMQSICGPIDAATVARGMIAALQQPRPGVRIVESGELQDLGRA